MKIKIKQLTDLVTKLLKKYGYTPKESKIISNILLYAQLRGNNQGVVKLIGNGIPKRKGVATPKIIKKSPVSALFDGNKTHAMIVMDTITNEAIKKAKKSGVGICGNFNSSESTGALGYYVKKIADQGLIGMAFASAPFKTTAPYGSTEALFCTNPLAFGFPTIKDSVVFDMTTSAMAYYGLIQAKTAGKKVPENIGYDKNGKPTRDPAEIMSGALMTLAGHKGSGLALVGQILASSFVRADYFDNDSDNAGNLVIAINPGIFLNKKDFVNDVTKMTARIKKATKLKGVDEINLPGERGDKLAKSRLRSGIIEVEDNLYKELQKVAEK